MMAIMDRLTDKPEWQRKVFDSEIVAKWKAEAMAIPDSEWNDISGVSVEGWGIMSEKAFEYVSLQPSVVMGRVLAYGLHFFS